MPAKRWRRSNGAPEVATEAPEESPVVETVIEAVPATAATVNTEVANPMPKRLKTSETISIEPRDASEWWRSAAQRWRTIFELEVTQPTAARETEAVSETAMVLCSGLQTCSLCCEDAAPWHGVRLACKHGWYCQECILRHANSRLERGAFDVTCPECEAMGAGVPLPERDLRRLLPAQLVETLLQRSLERAVSACGDLFFCPTPNCAYPVALEEGQSPHFVCPKCGESCCLRCRAQPWHRGMNCLKFAQRAKSKEADESFAQWMKETQTKQCPTCGCAVSKENLEKQSTQQKECHKMICRNCRTKFCFKCLTNLAETLCACTPWEHGFIDPNSRKFLAHREPKRPQVRSRRAGL